ncbi:hypothetical protein JCM6882_007790 [Rhodosporidiobolus microsporus]
MSTTLAALPSTSMQGPAYSARAWSYHAARLASFTPSSTPLPLPPLGAAVQPLPQVVPTSTPTSPPPSRFLDLGILRAHLPAASRASPSALKATSSAYPFPAAPPSNANRPSSFLSADAPNTPAYFPSFPPVPPSPLVSKAPSLISLGRPRRSSSISTRSSLAFSSSLAGEEPYPFPPDYVLAPSPYPSGASTPACAPSGDLPLLHLSSAAAPLPSSAPIPPDFAFLDPYDPEPTVLAALVGTLRREGDFDGDMEGWEGDGEEEGEGMEWEE